jgi:hypothetical protein
MVSFKVMYDVALTVFHMLRICAKGKSLMYSHYVASFEYFDIGNSVLDMMMFHVYGDRIAPLGYTLQKYFLFKSSRNTQTVIYFLRILNLSGTILVLIPFTAEFSFLVFCGQSTEMGCIQKEKYEHISL